MEFLPAVREALKDNNFQDAVDAARKHKKSHIAKVVARRAHRVRQRQGRDHGHATTSSARCGRALDRAVALTSAEMKKGTGRPGDDRLDRAVHRPVRHRRRHHQRVHRASRRRARAASPRSRPVSPRR